MNMHTGYTARSGGTSVQAARGFGALRGRGPAAGLGMLTVYQYGFSEPAPPKPSAPWGTYLLLAAAGWWAWARLGARRAS